MLDDLEIARCAACECEYGSEECLSCPLYEGEDAIEPYLERIEREAILRNE